MVIVVTGRRKRRDFKAVVIHTQRNATTLVAPILSAQMVENGTSLLMSVSKKRLGFNVRDVRESMAGRRGKEKAEDCACMLKHWDPI